MLDLTETETKADLSPEVDRCQIKDVWSQRNPSGKALLPFEQANKLSDVEVLFETGKLSSERKTGNLNNKFTFVIYK